MINYVLLMLLWSSLPFFLQVTSVLGRIALGFAEQVQYLSLNNSNFTFACGWYCSGD